ncbi:MAG: asparagine synthase (glutamine-hydrolyzing) [Alphaproteobacteria bacterium]|nr:asparagine synthase (glutamine-hydrolyzing) [Alphaproteobacteria bacterium]
MCGIAGQFRFDGSPASPTILRRMADAIAHRGPDGEGFYVDGNFGLAHRRLAIIDLSPAGHQPMQSPDGRYVLAYNGEIYNFQELRLELEALGHRFRSRTDSEVVLMALREWGERAIPRFNGMFAFALWDREKRELLLARDRYGIKPLYLAHSSHGVWFGSEIKAILADQSWRAKLDSKALVEYLTFQNFFTDRTLFENVRLLPAGSTCRIKEGGVGTPVRYWDFDFQEPTQHLSEHEYVERLDGLFRRAVSSQLISDVPVGSYLSGGVDSGSVAALAAREIPDLRSFTVGFDLHSASGIEMGFDERPSAEFMSYLFKTEHYEMVLKAGDMERCMRRLVWHLEEPRVGQSYPNFYAAQLASRFVKVTLSGAGGDELFGGYPWRYFRASAGDDFEHYVDKYYQFWQRLIPNRDLQRVMAPLWPEAKDVWTRDVFRDIFQHHAPALTSREDYINHSLYFEAKTFLHGLLVVEDKLSMAHSLETRVPFLDNALVDFAMTVPVALKLGNLDRTERINENEPGSKTGRYFARTRDGKLVLRKVLSRYVPERISEAEKQGFSGPDASWFRGESIDYVRDRIMDRRAAIYDFLDEKAVRGLIDEHLSGQANRRLLIWSLLYLEEWTQTFLKGEPTGPKHGQSRPRSLAA